MRSRVLGALAAASLCVSAVATPDAGAAPIVVREGLDGYSGTRDTQVWIQSTTSSTTASDLNNLNYGGWDLLVSRDQSNTRKRFILSFDLSGFAGQSVQEATLTLTKPTVAGLNTVQRDILGYQIHSGSAGWAEGSSNNTAEEGAASGNWKAYSATSPTAWTGTAGAVGNIGGALADAVADAVLPAASPKWTQADAAGTQYTLTLPTTMVQSWIDNPSQNAGLLFLNTGGSGIDVIFASSEHATAAWRPTLTLVVPEPGVLGLAAAGLPLLLARRRRAN